MPSIAFWGMVTAVLVFPHTSRAQDGDRDPKVQRDQWLFQYKAMQTKAQSFPTLSASQIQDVMQLKVERKVLTLSTPLVDPKHDMGAFRITCDPFKGPTFASVTQIGVPMVIGAAGARPAGAPILNPPMPRIFSFTSYEMPNPDELVTLTMQAYGDHLQINRQSRSGANSLHNVMLIQQRSGPGAGPDQSLVQLNVNDIGDTPSGSLPRNFSVESADFATLLHEHPREAEEYIRPLFRELGQEAALAPDERLAWQVLADHWQPDPEMARKVRQLLPVLNDGDFHARDKALTDLEALGMPGATVLAHLDRVSLSPEQNLMIDRTLAPFAQLSPRDATRLRSDTDFLTDCLYVGNPDVRAAALDRLKQVSGKELSFDLNAPESARPAAVSELRKQLAARAARYPD
jgi:hypothetical protein